MQKRDTPTTCHKKRKHKHTHTERKEEKKALTNKRTIVFFFLYMEKKRD